jgi:hypothetical protein
MTEDRGIETKLVVLSRDRQILAEVTGNGYRLPFITVPRFTRVAYAATLAAHEKYGVLLFIILSVHQHREDNAHFGIEEQVLVGRFQLADAELSTHLKWLNYDQRVGQLDRADQAALDSALSEFTLFDSGKRYSSFGKYCWLDELRAWCLPTLETLGLRETGIQQWNADPWFSLLQIKADSITKGDVANQRTLWFKAVGEPNIHEFTVTLALASKCPQSSPKIVATKPEWNGWLMEEVKGQELDAELDMQSWVATAQTLAEVQKRFIGEETKLLEVGCRDWRIPRILELLDSFFEDMEETMLRQPTSPPHILSHEELRDLKDRSRDLCIRVRDAGVPYTITHGDFSPHNVLISKESPILIDWAEAYVTFPFVSWEYFWNRTMKDHPEHVVWHRQMYQGYAVDGWASVLSKQSIEEGMKLAPAMAVLILALQGIHDPVERENRHRDKYKRSMIRRLQKEISTLETVGAI